VTAAVAAAGNRARYDGSDVRDRSTQYAAWLALAANTLLLAVKGGATGLSDSLTIFSETLNSLADVVGSVVLVLCVYWAQKRPDATHPFGHRRAEPLAGLVVAIFTGILGFEVCKTAVLDLLRGTEPARIGAFAMGALAFTALFKGALAMRFRVLARRLSSPALQATSVDCRNDVVVSLQGLLAVVMAAWRLPVLDRVAALIVGVYILYTAHRIGMENIDYLMGRAPDRHLVDRIRSVANAVTHVQAVVDVRAHYVGTLVHVELTAVVDGELSTSDSHDVAEMVRESVENIAPIDRAFVHIEPVGAERVAAV
jgi:cation diffusion facilitator family transporter